MQEVGGRRLMYLPLGQETIWVEPIGLILGALTRRMVTGE